MPNNYFPQMIRHLRQTEEVILYNNIRELSEDEVKETADFLEREFMKEAMDFPASAISFHKNSAIWAAGTVYTSAQLILYREHRPDDLVQILPAYPTEPSPSEIVSADLCLRFLPDMLLQLKLIDSEDALIPLLEKMLYTWHYSGIRYPLETENLVFNSVLTDPGMLQLYCDRIYQHKNSRLAGHPSLAPAIRGGLGLYARELWKELSIEIKTE